MNDPLQKAQTLADVVLVAANVFLVDSGVEMKEALDISPLAEKTLAIISHLGPDILVLGELADAGALPFLERLMGFQSGVRPVLLMDGTSRREFAEAVALGACGIVPKSLGIAALLKCIHCVHGGVILVHQNSSVRAAGPDKADLAFHKLTKRERELALAVAAGSSNRAIAEKLSISEITVKRRLVDVFFKLGVRSRVQLAKFAVDNDLQ